MTYTGFGTRWFDYDNDGNLDLFVANGAVRMTRLAEPTEYPYHQINQLFHNDGHGNYRETTARAGAALQLSEVSRGAAFGDIDNDGDVDILVTNNNGPVRLLLNEVGSRRHWLQVQLQGVTSNRYGMGARVGVIRNGKKSLWRRAHTDGSYLSANDHRVHFGLGLRIPRSKRSSSTGPAAAVRSGRRSKPISSSPCGKDREDPGRRLGDGASPDAGSLVNGDDSARLDVFKALPGPTRPLDLYPLDTSRLAEAEMNT